MRDRVGELFKDTPRPWLATEVKLCISANLVPPASATSVPVVEELTGTVKDALTYWCTAVICDGTPTAEIDTESENRFELTFTRNIPIPTEIVNGVLYGNGKGDGIAKLAKYCHDKKLV